MTVWRGNPRILDLPGGPARIVLRLLGGFRLLKDNRRLQMRPGGKGELLLVNLALRLRDGIDREELTSLLWPESDEALAAQSLHTLSHDLRRAVGDALDGEPVVVRRDGRLWLNVERGIAVDVEEFEARAAIADRLHRAGDDHGAIPWYEKAVGLYDGDLVLGSDIRHLLERERLRARYLSLLAALAQVRFDERDYEASKERALELLSNDPCREDAHRMLMQCFVRQGQRAQAIRQYEACRRVLEREFEVEPEPATQELLDVIRRAPDQV